MRIWSWNVNGLDVWDLLDSDAVDVALLQEARLPRAAWARQLVPDPADGWGTAGWRAGTWSRRTAVVKVSDTYPIRPIPLTTFADGQQGHLPVSRPGTLAVAELELGGETIIVASMYGWWDSSVRGRKIIFADASAHRGCRTWQR